MNQERKAGRDEAREAPEGDRKPEAGRERPAGQSGQEGYLVYHGAAEGDRAGRPVSEEGESAREASQTVQEKTEAAPRDKR